MADKRFNNKNNKDKEQAKPTLDDALKDINANEEEVVEEAPKDRFPSETVTMVDDVNLTIGERKYRLVYNHREGFDAEKLGKRFSDVLSRYDYVVGDWGFEQLRLKGFFNATHKKAPADQRIDTLEDYLYEYCNFGCAFFVIERIGGKHDLRASDGEKPRKKRKRKNRKNYNGQAFIDEKKGPVQNTNAKKSKPVVKTRKPNNRQESYSKSEKGGNEKHSFTIRKKETSK
jgi:uncharacterized protein YutD